LVMRQTCEYETESRVLIVEDGRVANLQNGTVADQEPVRAQRWLEATLAEDQEVLESKYELAGMMARTAARPSSRPAVEVSK
jgi:hypothetical protein